MSTHTPLTLATEPGQPHSRSDIVAELPINRRSLGFRYAQSIVRFRWVIIAIWIIGFAVSLPFSAQVTQHLSSGGFQLNGSESVKAGDIISQKFAPPRPEALVVFQSASIVTSDPAYHQEIEQFIAAAGAFPHVAQVTTNAQPSKDGRTTFVTVAFDNDFSKAQDAMDAFKKILPTTGPAKVYLSGDPAVYNQITNITKADLGQSEEFTLPVAAIALLFIFGTLVATAIPLGLAIVAIPIVLAIIYAISLQTEMSIYVVNIATIIGLGLSIDYSLFMVRRFRDELRLGRTAADAVGVTLATSGEAILFSGLTVLIGFSALSLVGLSFMTSIAIGGAALVVVAVLGALTLVPAVLSLLGAKINAAAIPHPWRKKQAATADPEATGFWHRWALGVMNHPWAVLVSVLVLLAFLSYPLFSLAIGLPGTSVLPPANEARLGEMIVQQQFPSDQVSPVIMVVQTRDGSSMLTSANIQRLCDLTRNIAAVPATTSVIGLTADASTPCTQFMGVYSSGAYLKNPQTAQLVKATTNGDTTLITVAPRDHLDSASSKAVVAHLRGLEKNSPFAIKVGGFQAVSIDLGNFLYGNFPKALIFIFIATYIVLLAMFRSVLLPIKAVVMNVLSVAAAYGALVWVFQQGHLTEQLQFTSEGFIEMTVPILLFCILFGLSMDYEVFLLSRVREEWDRTGNNRYAVARGLEKTAGVITSAALIIIIVSVAFIFTHLTLTKEQGLGIAVAVFVDATIIRILLVPATMRLLGRWNWWFPGRKAAKVMAGE